MAYMECLGFVQSQRGAIEVKDAQASTHLGTQHHPTPCDSWFLILFGNLDRGSTRPCRPGRVPSGVRFNGCSVEDTRPKYHPKNALSKDDI